MKSAFSFFYSHLICRFLSLATGGIRLYSQLCKPPEILEAYFKIHLPKFIPKLQANERENAGQNQNGPWKATSNGIGASKSKLSCVGVSVI